MIGCLKGIILHKRAPHLLLDVAGVGYEVMLPLSVFYKLPDIGAEVFLHTHLSIRDDEHLLYGFIDASERALFRQLIKVSGIGPKTALTILSSTTPDMLASFVAEDNTAALSRLPGIGKKTAQRLLIDMRDKLGNFVSGGASGVVGKSVLEDETTPAQDAMSALIALGYSPQRSQQVVTKLAAQAENADATSEGLIKLALKKI